MEAFISKIEKKYHIYLIIIIAVVIYTSVIVLPHNVAGRLLSLPEIERYSIVQNLPGINVGKAPSSMALDYFNNVVYVANAFSNTVSVINGDTLKVSNVPVGEGPSNIAYGSKVAYVANSESNTIDLLRN